MTGGPNLASRPFVNDRPVWLVTAVAAAVVAVTLGLLGISHLQGNRTLAERIADRDELQRRHDAIIDEVRTEVRNLERVPWRSLAARISSTNVILRERAFSWLEMLDDIEEVLPYDVRIIKITPKVEGERVLIGLDAVCRTREALLELLDNMIQDPRFAEPTPRSEVLPEASDSATFELTFTVTYLPGEAES
jgi:hypothetical protein